MHRFLNLNLLNISVRYTITEKWYLIVKFQPIINLQDQPINREQKCWGSLYPMIPYTPWFGLSHCFPYPMILLPHRFPFGVVLPSLFFLYPLVPPTPWSPYLIISLAHSHQVPFDSLYPVPSVPLTPRSPLPHGSPTPGFLLPHDSTYLKVPHTLWFLPLYGHWLPLPHGPPHPMVLPTPLFPLTHGPQPHGSPYHMVFPSPWLFLPHDPPYHMVSPTTWFLYHMVPLRHTPIYLRTWRADWIVRRWW